MDVKVIDVPEGLEITVDGKLEFITTLYGLKTCKRSGTQLVLEGLPDNVSRAQNMLPAFFLALKKRSAVKISKSIRIPAKLQLDLPEINAVLSDQLVSALQVELLQNSINVSGDPDNVETAVERIEHFLELVKPSPKPSKRRSSVDSGTPQAKHQSCHKRYPCIFCHAEKSTRHFRDHCVNVCKVREAMIFSKEEKNELISQFYTMNYEQFATMIENKISLKKESLQRPEKISLGEPVIHSNPARTDRISIDNLVRQFQDFLLNPCSGKARFQSSTLSGRISRLERLINTNKLFYLDELLEKESVMNVLSNIENMDIEDGSRYEYALVVKEFLSFCHQEDSLSPDIMECIRKGIIRWDNARETFQKGLVKNRAKKKKEEVVLRENGKYPHISEVSMCEAYYMKKVPTISKSSFNNTNLKRFYGWLAFYFSKSNALRPSSFGNMKLTEFNSFKRGELKIVCVEGNHLTNFVTCTINFFAECKNSEDNYGYVIIEPPAFALITRYIHYWRPLCVSKILNKETSKKKSNLSDYLFLYSTGKKINSFVGKLVDIAWNRHRVKFCLEPKQFTLSRMRKAAQSKFEDEMRGGDKSVIRKAFNSGIGHT